MANQSIKVSGITIKNSSNSTVYYNMKTSSQWLYDYTTGSENELQSSKTINLSADQLLKEGSSDGWTFCIYRGGEGNPWLMGDEQISFDKNSVYVALYEVIAGGNSVRLMYRGLYFKDVTYKEKINDVYYPTPFEDSTKSNIDFENATRGYVEGTMLSETIMTDSTASTPPVAWDMPSYDFIKGEAPKSVHKNLWRMEMLNNYNGIFQVYPKVDGSITKEQAAEGIIYQARSYDLATMTFIKSDTGWIVIDPLGGSETVRKAWNQFATVVGGNPLLKAILITHSHVDHYKGVGELLNEFHAESMKTSQKDFNGKIEYTDSKKEILVLAPTGFYEESISENLYLGNCMGRRAIYMYGSALPRSIYGHVGSGLGKSVGTETGTIPEPSFEVVPNVEGETDIAEITIDGIKFTFQNVPGTEAPAEMHIGFKIKDGDKEIQILCPGENVTHTMHNLLTPRGAKVRDPKAFGKAIDRALELFPNTQIIIGTHHWPTWNEIGEDGNMINNCREIMEKERDMYYYFNDQVIRMLNMGMNMEEIAEIFKLPDALNNEYYNRGYYGTINHDVKAVAQRYIGWWDGNPANYFKYPEVEVAKRFVADMGGEKAVLEKAQQYFKAQDYRWTVELTRQLVFFNSKNTEARLLEADALEQLGYSFEAGTWRNIFLSAALELRGLNLAQGMPGNNESFVQSVGKNLRSLLPVYAFEYLSVLINGLKAANTQQGKEFTIQFDSPNTKIRFNLNNGVLHHKVVDGDGTAYITFKSVEDFASDWIGYKTEGKSSKLSFLYDCIDFIDGQWHIIEPLKDTSII